MLRAVYISDEACKPKCEVDRGEDEDGHSIQPANPKKSVHSETTGKLAPCTGTSSVTCVQSSQPGRNPLDDSPGLSQETADRRGSLGQAVVRIDQTMGAHGNSPKSGCEADNKINNSVAAR